MIRNPVLKGFCPDPSVVRVGDDYYLATSTFEWWPGVRLWHSRDLEHWQQIQSPLRRRSQLDMVGNPNNGGIWAPDISYKDGIFYLVYTDVKTQKQPYYNTHNYVVWTDNINGEWSEPVYLNSMGFDPSLFHAPDGRTYLVNMRNGFKGILLQEFDLSRKELVGEIRTIFNGTDRGFTEGPHLYWHDDWYYLLVAEGGTGYRHCVTIARSRDIQGPYVIDPDNPILSSVDASHAMLQKAGHADLVKTQNGQWYMFHLCSQPENGISILGRETAIQKISWTDDGWIRPVGGRIPQEMVAPPEGLHTCAFPDEPTMDDFDSPVLQPFYTSLRIPLDGVISLTERSGWLRLFGQESITSRHHVSLVARRQTSHSCTVKTCMEFHPDFPEQAAGLCYIYNNENYHLLVLSMNDANMSVLRLETSIHGSVTRQEILLSVTKEDSLHLGLSVVGLTAQFSYAVGLDGDWIDAFTPLDISILSDEKAPGFTGAHFALYCHDMTGQRKPADFDYLNIWHHA
ncbi:glycoside hydrolase family 43 protein [Parasphaerochaeta coccoides]|uniref:Xylan 1,4-beta-xylosidase n=1 Tax=Parasphaerochaeta coccoides (strain ATCC BAA-1237 / DSM 17374 / SPN1) TaxID=760011 RepID=F4GKY4_PARC1|nr:glycoside hydrolase family 43 protein [Parasphaerochaeta coccoides]AEC01897.1 Xylan 1,4-beta-xylosidase [Parasphaerochaeta coccoides DSM 17374]